MNAKTPQQLAQEEAAKERFDRAIANLSSDSRGVVASAQSFFQTLMPVSERAVYEARMKEHVPELMPSRFKMTSRMQEHKPAWDALHTQYGELPIPIAPVAAEVRLTSTFGGRENPFEGQRRPHGHNHKEEAHRGIDLAPAERRAKVPVIAAMPGVVIEVTPERRSGGFGNLVRVVGLDGRIYEYGHLKNFAVKEGDVVHQGNRIGIMGNTGRSTATHLHYGIIVRAGDEYAYVSPDINGHTLDKSLEGKIRLSAAQEIPKIAKDTVRLAALDDASGHGLTPQPGSRNGGHAPSRG